MTRHRPPTLLFTVAACLFLFHFLHPLPKHMMVSSFAMPTPTTTTTKSSGTSSSSITIMGGGNFGLALATLCSRQGHNTTVLVRDPAVANQINTQHTHPRYQKGIVLNSGIQATVDASGCLPHANLILHAVPCQYSRSFWKQVEAAKYIPPTTPIVSVSKGIEISSLSFMEQVLQESLGGSEPQQQPLAFLSGPSFAKEIIEGVATCVVVASHDPKVAKTVARTLSDDRFKCFTSQDVMGVECGGAIKNVIAIGAGMCEGLDLGINALAGLVTRGTNEMRRFAVSLGAHPSTIAGLSGVGDTFATCFGPLSRNRKFGYRLGQGETAAQIRASTKEVAEGVDTAKALVQLIQQTSKSTKGSSKYRLDLKYPILFGIANILEGKQTPQEGLEALMTMPLQQENFDEQRSYYSYHHRLEEEEESLPLQEEEEESLHEAAYNEIDHYFYDEELAKLDQLEEEESQHEAFGNDEPPIDTTANYDFFGELARLDQEEEESLHEAAYNEIDYYFYDQELAKLDQEEEEESPALLQEKEEESLHEASYNEIDYYFYDQELAKLDQLEEEEDKKSPAAVKPIDTSNYDEELAKLEELAHDLATMETPHDEPTTSPMEQMGGFAWR